jgi:hypothetical protein
MMHRFTSLRFDAFKDVSHDAMVTEVNKVGPHFSHKRQESVAGLARVAVVEQAFDRGAGSVRESAQLTDESGEVVVGRLACRAHGWHYPANHFPFVVLGAG